MAGATRGAGRGIAVSLGEAGATVYCTGRSTRKQRSEYDRPETIEETAELVDAAGGEGIAVAVDHLRPSRSRRSSARIDAEQGRLDVLVNDIWGGEKLFEWDTPLWEHDLDAGLRMLRLAIDTHLDHEPLRAAAADPPAGRPRRRDDRRHARVQRRELPAVGVLRPRARPRSLRLAFAQAKELEPHGCTAVALTPGWMRSEMMLDIYRVTEETWRDATIGSPHFSRDLRVPALRRPGGRGARRRPRTSRSATAARSPRAASRASTASRTSTARSPTAGATWSRSRTPACRRTRPATADAVRVR